MINRIALISICTIATGANLCAAQLNDVQSITNWGQSIQGFKLAIKMTNNVFKVGSPSVVTAVFGNSSTNSIIVDLTAPSLNFDAMLTNDTGRLYHISTTNIILLLPRQLVTIEPGEQSVEDVPVTFGQEIEPGNYSLKAARTFTLNDSEFTLESNSIKVTLTK